MGVQLDIAALADALSGYLNIEDITPSMLDAQVEATAGILALDERLLGAFSSSTNELHITGVPDTDETMGHALIGGKYTTLRNLASEYDFMRKPYDALYPSQRRQKYRPRNWQDPTQVGRTLAAQANQTTGMTNTHTLMSMATTFDLAYSPELGLRDSAVVKESNRPFLVERFGRRAVAKGISQTQLALRMRDEARVDNSLEALVARVDNAEAIMQVELAACVVRSLGNMWLAGGKNAQVAEALFVSFAASLLEDTMQAKSAIFLEVQQAFGQLGAGCQGNESMFLRCCERGMQMYARDIDHFKGMMGRVLAVRGAALPAWLRRDAATTQDVIAEVILPARTQTIAVVGVTAMAKEVEESTEERREPLGPSREQIELRTSQANTFRASVTKTSQDWTMNAKARKMANIDTVPRAFMQLGGCVDKDGKVLVARMERREAEDMAAVLHQLGRMGGRANIAGAQRQLQETADRHDALAIELQKLQHAALQDRVYGLEYAHVVPLRRYVDRLRAEWPQFAEALRSVWPEASVDTLIANIGRLLFTSPQRSPQEVT